MYNTNQLWTDLALSGRGNLTMLNPKDEVFAEQIRAEADEEGVRVRVDYKLNKSRGDYTAYVYLRKN